MKITNMTNENDELKKLGQNIAKIRKSMDFSQNILAEKADISREHLAKIETGKRYISLKLLFKLAKLLNVDVKDFFIFK